MKPRAFLVLLCCVGSLLPQSVGAEITAEQVNQAIQRGVEYLQREQRTDGSWADPPGYPGGVTAVCTLALLNCGVPPKHESVQNAVNYLRKLKPQMTYSTALQTMVFCAAEPATNMALIKRNALWLEQNQKKGAGQYAGAWGYPQAEGDNSNSQFALLALHEAERVGVEVNDRTWELARNYWIQGQNSNGSWGYKPSLGGTGSMTCAGIAAMVITNDRLSRGDAEADGDLVTCCGQQQDNVHLELALNWMGRNFSVHVNPGNHGQQPWLFYYLYGIERAGRLTNQRFIGDHDWYREGADLLVSLQDQLSGYWKGTGHAEDDPHLGTSLALLFLAKGRRPVLCAKLKHEPLDDWNHHRSDLGNLTSYVETRWGRDLTWQVIDAAATTDDMLESPVLFINGGSAPRFSDVQVERLRAYVNQGGFILAEATCEGGDFEQGFEQLVKRMFPEPEYRLHDLPLDHPAYTAEGRVDTSVFQLGRTLKGIDVGCRTSVIFSPAELRLSCLWELARPGREKKFSPSVQSQIDAARSLGANILAYATNREVKYKLDLPHDIASTEMIDPFDRLKLYIGKVKHGGSWNAAPGALMNLLHVVHRETGMRVNTDQREVALNEPQLFEYPIVYMHGRTSFRLSDEERKELKTYVERGGVLLADAVCGSDAFVKSFRREIHETFGKPLEPIAAAHPMFTNKFGGFGLSTVRRRDPHRGGGDGALKSTVVEVQPELEGLSLDDRYAIIFSPLDISCALERHESLECPGYVREDAARIGLNLVLYAMEQ